MQEAAESCCRGDLFCLGCDGMSYAAVWGTGDIDADTAVVAADVLSRQALAGQAEDLALEDAMYELDKNLQDSSQPADAYLKQVLQRPVRARAFGKAMSLLSSMPVKDTAGNFEMHANRALAECIAVASIILCRHVASLL